MQQNGISIASRKTNANLINRSSRKKASLDHNAAKDNRQRLFQGVSRNTQISYKQWVEEQIPTKPKHRLNKSKKLIVQSPKKHAKIRSNVARIHMDIPYV